MNWNACVKRFSSIRCLIEKLIETQKEKRSIFHKNGCVMTEPSPANIVNNFTFKTLSQSEKQKKELIDEKNSEKCV